MAATASKKHSKLDKQDVTQGLNPLFTPPAFENNAQCVDIIAVPGLGADMTYTWMANKVHWLRDESMLPKMIPNARITVFGYRSQWYGPDAVEVRLPSIGEDLLHAIKTDRRDSKHKKRPIIFVGHSLGGLVIAKAVSKAKRQPEDFPEIINCITACVFLGTPFRGSESQPLAKIIGLAGSTLGVAKYSGLIRTLKSGSTELDDLADDFLGDVGKTQIDLECYYELEKTNGMLVADQKSATFEGKPKHSWARNHSQMNKFEGPKDVNYRDLAGTLKDLAQQSFKKLKLRNDAVRQEILNDSRVETILEALEVINPKKDLETIKRVSGTGAAATTSWMQNDDKYLAWKNGPSSQNLWICGSPGKGKTIAAISMVEELSQLRSDDGDRDDSIVLAHFFCDEQEKDKSKALNLLKCLAWQLLKAKRYLIRHFFGEDNKPKGGVQKSGAQKGDSGFEFNSIADLWKCVKAALSDPSLGTIYFLVNGLDQIDSVSRKEFLSLLASFQPPPQGDDGDASGPRLKWLFLSVHRDDIRDALQHALILNLDDGSNSTRQDDDLRAYVGQKISTLSKEEGYSRSLEYFVKSFISFRAKGKSNYDWVNLVCLELKNDKLPHAAVRQHLEGLPSDLYPMYDQVSDRVLHTSQIEVEYTKDILRSLLLVHWPPTLLELAVISGLPEEDQTDPKAIQNYVQRCGAFTTSFEDGATTKVQLSHTSVREFLKSKADDWLSMGSEQIQHGIIALRCFEYVLSTVKLAEVDEQASGKGVEEDDDDDTDDDVGEDDETDGGTDDGTDDGTNDGTNDGEDHEKDHAEDHEKDHAEDHGEDHGKDQGKDHGSEDHKSVKSEKKKNPAKKPKHLQYPYSQWIVHALEATADIVENFGLEDVFWVLGSKERAKWSKSYSKLNPDQESGVEFDANFTALHIAAYFGYVTLADLLLRKGTHEKEIQTMDSQGFQPLYWACRRGHMDMVQKLCEVGADVNVKENDEEHGITMLHGAVWSGNEEIVEYLLNHKAAIDVPNKEDGTALYVAAEEEHLEIVQLLLDRKANPNLAGGEDVNPLNVAASAGNLEIVKLLVAKGAELNPAVEYEYGNAVGVACLLGELEVAEYLLLQGCHFNVKDSTGCSPLDNAATGGYPGLVELLLRYDVDPESHQKALLSAIEEDEQPDCVKVLVEKCPHLRRSEAFGMAASKGYVETLKLLTSNGIEPEVLEKALYEATDYQHEEAVKLLLDMGIDPNAEGEEYGNALQASAFDGTSGILKMLLDKGAHPNRCYLKSDYGTALQAACYEGNIENVKLLIERGATVNNEICGEFGTPLQAASFQGGTEIVQLLLEHRANPNAEGGSNEYAIVAATEAGHADILELLIKYGAQVNVTNPRDGCTPLINAAMNLPKSSVELLVNHGADIRAHDHDNDNALTSGASSGDAETILYLLEQGSDIQNIGTYGGALYRATEIAAIDCMKILLEHKINVNQEGGDMHTSLQAAASLGELECVELLLSHGADVHEIGGTYHTALQAAVSASSLEITHVLLDRKVDTNAIGGKYGTALHAAVDSDDAVTFIDLLLEHHADINIVAETGTPLHLACVVSDISVVTHLLDNGADPNIVGGKYGTALQASCFMTTEEEIQLLLDRGADPMIKGGFYGNALTAAAAGGVTDVLKIILTEDTPPDMLVPALHYAVHYREQYTVELLLEHGANVTAASHLYGSAFEALEAELTPEERKQRDGDADDWFEDEDDEEDDDDDDDDDDAQSKKGKENDADDTGSDGSSEDGDEEREKEEEEEAQVEIKKMLDEALAKASSLAGVDSIQDTDKHPASVNDQINLPPSPFSFEEPQNTMAGYPSPPPSGPTHDALGNVFDNTFQKPIPAPAARDFNYPSPPLDTPTGSFLGNVYHGPGPAPVRGSNPAFQQPGQGINQPFPPQAPVGPQPPYPSTAPAQTSPDPRPIQRRPVGAPNVGPGPVAADQGPQRGLQPSQSRPGLSPNPSLPYQPLSLPPQQQQQQQPQPYQPYQPYRQQAPPQQPYQAPPQQQYQTPPQQPYQAPSQQQYQAPLQQPYQAPPQQPYQPPPPQAQQQQQQQYPQRQSYQQPHQLQPPQAQQQQQYPQRQSYQQPHQPPPPQAQQQQQYPQRQSYQQPYQSLPPQAQQQRQQQQQQSHPQPYQPPQQQQQSHPQSYQLPQQQQQSHPQPYQPPQQQQQPHPQPHQPQQRQQQPYAQSYSSPAQPPPQPQQQQHPTRPGPHPAAGPDSKRAITDPFPTATTTKNHQRSITQPGRAHDRGTNDDDDDDDDGDDDGDDGDNGSDDDDDDNDDGEGDGEGDGNGDGDDSDGDGDSDADADGDADGDGDDSDGDSGSGGGADNIGGKIKTVGAGWKNRWKKFRS